MARRRRLKLRSAKERIESFNAGINVGALKYQKKTGLMKIHYRGVSKFAARVNRIVADVLDERRMTGFDRGMFQGSALRVARFIVKYHKFPDDILANMAEAVIAEQAVESGVAGTDRETEFVDTMREIAGRLIRDKETLWKLYLEGYEGELWEREQKVQGGGE